MALKRFLMIGFVAVLVACGDDDSSDFATRPSGDSSSASEDCEDSSCSKVKSSSSSRKKGEAGTESGTSSSAKSSSSSVASSSSVPEGYVDPSTVVKGTMTDERDGKTYKTVTIGSQTWMAENLNYETTDSYCYNDIASNCTKFGRLYIWAAAMDSVGTWSANGKDCGF